MNTYSYIANVIEFTKEQVCSDLFECLCGTLHKYASGSAILICLWPVFCLYEDH